MKRIKLLCLLTVLLSYGCIRFPGQDQYEHHPRFAPPAQEVTNGVYVVFQAAPPSAITGQLLGAGASQGTNVLTFTFTVVDNQAKRDAITTALLNGAHLRGTQP